MSSINGTHTTSLLAWVAGAHRAIGRSGQAWRRSSIVLTTRASTVYVRIHRKGFVEPKDGAKRIRTADLLDVAVKIARAPLTAS
jgi:hypothetical protein